MPILISPRPEYELVIVHYAGRVTMEESLDSFRSFIEDADPLPQRILIDLRDVQNFDLQLWKLPGMVRSKMRLIKDGMPVMETAIIARNPLLRFGTMAYKKLAEGFGKQTVHLFDNREDALAALGLPADLQ
ncbi:hypothetical protein [Primorskyibacter sp. S187A]|uniref:hypothetical protein n=1 Tax=Primorskyibacter sp. S187A TaxID=3415130 RepID=UPI003C7A85DB